MVASDRNFISCIFNNSAGWSPLNNDNLKNNKLNFITKYNSVNLI